MSSILASLLPCEYCCHRIIRFHLEDRGTNTVNPYSYPCKAIPRTWKNTRPTDKHLNKRPFYNDTAGKPFIANIILHSFPWNYHWKHLGLIPLTKKNIPLTLLHKTPERLLGVVKWLGETFSFARPTTTCRQINHTLFFFAFPKINQNKIIKSTLYKEVQVYIS